MSRIKLHKEISLVVQSNPTSYGITQFDITLAVRIEGDNQLTRLDFQGQQDKDNRSVYAIGSTEKNYLFGFYSMGNRKHEISNQIINDFKKWLKKNDDLFTSNVCELQVFEAFLNRKFKVSRYYSWDTFTENTFKKRVV